MKSAWLGMAVACAALGCSGNSAPPPVDGGEQTAACEAKGLVHAVPSDAHHTQTCSEACGNGLNPPTGGPHCPTPLECRAFGEAQPLCRWVHNLEHGHAVLLYNCPQGCPEIVEALKQLWTDVGADGKSRRILITPDPGLQRKVAAVVWGWSWTGDAFDADAVNCVLSHQDQEAPEANLGCVP